MREKCTLVDCRKRVAPHFSDFSSLVEGPLFSSLLLGSLDLHLDFPDPSNPIFMGTAGISGVYLAEVLSRTPVHYPYIIFLYSILIPQHPVPLASMSPNLPLQPPQHPRREARGKPSLFHSRRLSNLFSETLLFFYPFL